MALVHTSHQGPALSPIVAGTWRLADWGWSAQQTLQWIEGCLDLGVSTFDHADVYGDYMVESLFGDGLALRPSLRDKMQLVSKCGIKRVSLRRPAHACKSYDSSRAHIVASVESSLKAMRTDRLDLLLIHRPDALLDAEEVAATFEALRRGGKVLHFGVSNFSPRQFDLLHSAFPLATNQIELNPLRRNALYDGTLEQAQQLKIRPMVWSPLAGGKLIDAGDSRASAMLEVLRRVADVHGVSPTTVAFAWVMRHPSRPLPVAGTRRIDALRDAVLALGVELDRESWYAILQAGSGEPLL